MPGETDLRMPDVHGIIAQVEFLIEHEAISSPATRNKTRDEYRMSVCAIVHDIKHILRDEQYPLILAKRDLIQIAG